MKFIPVILSSGAGTRLWPVSRELHPKPFIRLSDGQSLLQKTFIRAAELPDVAEVSTVTNRDLYFKTQDEYRTVDKANLLSSYVIEPSGRNTAPAIAVAALHTSELYGSDAILLVLSADHLIANRVVVKEAVEEALRLPSKDCLLRLAFNPTHLKLGMATLKRKEIRSMLCRKAIAGKGERISHIRSIPVERGDILFQG